MVLVSCVFLLYLYFQTQAEEGYLATECMNSLFFCLFITFFWYGLQASLAQ